MKKFFLGSCGLVLFLIGIGFAGPPKWLSNGYDKKYPAEKYLCGVGVGKTLEEARASARAEISRIFRTRIVQAESNKQSETNIAGRKNIAETRSETAVQTYQTTAMVLEGIEIADTYFDKKQKNYYARAVLNRQNARQAISRQMSDIDMEIEKDFSLVQKTEATLAKIPLLEKILKLQQEQQELARQRHILEPNYPGNIARVTDETALHQLKKKIKFAFAESSSPEVREVLSEKITAAGFEVASSSAISTAEYPLIVIDSRIKISPSDRENPRWKFARWEINQNLLNDGQIISSRYQNGEESQLTMEAALQRARDKSRQIAAELFRNQIAGDIFKEIAEVQNE